MRYYGTAYKSNLTESIDNVKASIDSETYSSEINSVYVASKYNYLKEQAQGTASNAITGINTVRTKFDYLKTTIESFYGDVDSVSAGMSEKISHIQTLLEGVTSSMNEMTSLLDSHVKYNNIGITSSMIDRACSKLDETEDKDFLYFRDCYYEKFMDKNGKINESAVDDYVEMFNKNRGIPNSARERAMLAAFNDATFIYLTDKNTTDSDMEDLFNMYMNHFLDQNMDFSSVSDQVLVEYTEVPDKNGNPSLAEVVWFNYSMNDAGKTFVDTFESTMNMAYYIKPSDITASSFCEDYRIPIIFSDCMSRFRNGGNIAIPYFIENSDSGLEKYSEYRKKNACPGPDDYTDFESGKFFLNDCTNVKKDFFGRFQISYDKSYEDFWNDGNEKNATPYYISTISFRNDSINGEQTNFCEFYGSDGEITSKTFVSSTKVYSCDMNIGEDLSKYQEKVDRGFIDASKMKVQNPWFLNICDGYNTIVTAASNTIKGFNPDSYIGKKIGNSLRAPTSFSPLVFTGQSLTSLGYFTECPFLLAGGAVVSYFGNCINRGDSYRYAQEYNKQVDMIEQTQIDNFDSARFLRNTKAMGAFYTNNDEKDTFAALPTVYISPSTVQMELCYYGITHKDVGMLSFDDLEDPKVKEIMTKPFMNMDSEEFKRGVDNYFEEYCDRNGIEGIDIYSLTNQDMIKVCDAYNKDWFHDGAATQVFEAKEDSKIDIPGLDMSKYTYSGE